MNNPHASAISHQLSALGRAAASAIFLAFATTGWGQTLFDTFGDGNFSANPTWSGNTTAWGIQSNSDAAAGATGSNTLRLASTGTATVYLSSQISSWGDSQEWGIWIGRRAQAFTAANQAYFWLVANESDLRSATVDGYRLAIGDDTGGDEIRLEYIVNGAVSATVITSSGSLNNGLTDIGFLVRVTRSSSGGWALFTSSLPTSNGNGAIATDVPNSTNANVSQGTATNNTQVPASNNWLGLAALHSSGASAIISTEYDQIYFTPITAPTGVTTGTAGSITASGATISTSNVSADGGSAITERGVVYATASNPTTSNTKVTASGTTGNFDSTLTGLAASTTYYVRAYATNSVGTTYGSDVSFTTSSASTPTLTAATLASALTATYPSASSGVSFTAAGTNLTENILVTAQSGYEVSTSSGSGYGASVSVATGTTVWVRFAASRAAGDYNTATAAVLSSTGAANVNVTTSSSGNTISKGTPSISAAPTASNITFGQTLANSNLTGGTASVAGSFAFTTPATAPAVGTTSQSVTFTPTDTTNYNTAATNVNVTVNKASQTITFGALASKTFNDAAYSLTATASSGLSVTYTSSNASVATIAGSTVTIVGAGSATITASQSGDSNYNAASSVDQTLTVNKASQTITFPAQASLGVGSTRTLNATTTSGLAITYTSSNTSVATISGGNVTGVAAGTTTINATQAGDANWNPATLVGQSLTVAELPLLSENMGTPSATTAIASNNFQNNSTLTFSGDADVRNTTVSSGYTGASGGGNVFITNSVNRTFEISGINTYGYTNLALSFGQFKNTTGANNELAVEVSSDGTNYTALTYSRATGGGTADWILVAPTGTIPAVSNLRIRFRNTSTLFQWRIDDVVLTGTKTPTIAASGTPAALTTTYGAASSNTSFTVNGTFMTAGILVTPPSGFEVSTDGTSYSSTVTVGSSGSIANTTVYLRLAATASAGAKSGNIVLSSSGATNVNVATTASTVNAATLPTVTFTPPASLVYNRTAKTYTASATGPSSLTLNYTGRLGTTYSSATAPTAVGNYTVTATTSDTNYTGSQALDFTITPKALTITGASATNRAYNGLLTVAITGGSLTTGSGAGQVETGDTVSLGGSASGTVTTAAVADGKSVTVTGFSLTGADSANYSLTQPTGLTVNITAAPLTISGISIANKTYDGNTTATITGTAAYSGLVNSESHSVTGTATALFGNATVGSNKPVTVSGYTAPNGNYSITQPTGLTGNITAASVTVTAGNQTKAFGASDPTLTYTSSPSSLIAGNSFSGALSRAAGEGVGTYAISQGTLSAGSNYTISFVGANLTITQATPSITTAPTASTITSGQALSSSVLSGGVANVAGSFAFTTPATVPSPGISSQGVTFTPTDTGNYTAQTTSVNVGVLCTAPVLTRATLPTGTGFTVNWGAVTGAGNYTVLHSASKNMSSATSADTTSTSLTLTVSPGIRFVQVRANNAAGASANSTMQVNQLRSLAAGSTTYLSVPGVVNGGNATIAEIFGSNNEAGLEVGGNDSTSTNILRLNDNGSTQPGVWYFSGNWVRADTIVNTEIIPAGKAFMLRNRSSVVDHILLVGTPAEGPPAKVNITASGGNHTLMTPARTQSTALNALNLRPPGGNSTNQIKAATIASQADLVIVPRSTGLPRGYYFDATMNGGAGGWRSAGGNPIADPTTISVPSGGAFFIRKASDSTFTEWTPPAEE